MPEHPVTIGLARVRERIDQACRQSGREISSVRLLAVCKRIPLEAVVEAVHAGQRDLGENRIQDALPRQSALARLLEEQGVDPAAIRWHFIGHLQRNKAGKAAGAFDLLHAVDSVRLAQRLEDRIEGDDARQSVLLEVNTSGEDRKHGVTPAEAVEVARHIAVLPRVRLMGLMTMGRFGADLLYGVINKR